MSGLLAIVLSLAAQDVSFEEKRLATIPEGIYAQCVEFSLSGRAVAYTANGKFPLSMDEFGFPDVRIPYVYRNEERVAEFDRVWPPRLSEDGSTIAFMGNRGGKPDRNGRIVGGAWSVFVGKTEGPKFDEIGGCVLSRDGKIAAYQAREGKSWFVLVNGERYGPFDELKSPYSNGTAAVIQPLLSPDGKTVAFNAKKDGKWRVVANGKPGDAYDFCGEPLWTPDGTSVAYWANGGGGRDMVGRIQGGEWFMVVGSKKSGPYQCVGNPVFSADGKRVAFAANRGGAVNKVGNFAGGKWFVTVDAEEAEAFDGIEWGPTFSLDGTRIAYVAEENGRQLAIIDGTHGLPFDRVGPPQFSSDGSACAYEGGDFDDDAMRPMLHSRVVLNGKPGPEFTGVHDIVLNRDGRHVAYEAEGKLIVDGEVRDESSREYSQVTWSPDGRTLVYVSRGENPYRVVVGAKTSEEFESVGALHFSADGKKVAFGARKGRELWWKVMDVK